METGTTNGAVTWLERWLIYRRSILESMGLKVERSKSDFGSAAVSLDSNKIASGICAWDQRDTLEIQLIDLDTNESSLVFDGPCPSKEFFLEELTNYENWLKKKHEFSN